MKQREKTIFIILIAVMIFCPFLGKAQMLLHFDANQQNFFQFDKDGNILSWKSCVGDFSLTVDSESVAPKLRKKTGHDGKMSLVFDGQSRLKLHAAAFPELRFGSLHVFVIARLKDIRKKSVILGMGKEYPTFNMASDGSNFRLETGATGNQHPEGNKTDKDWHLIEFSHVTTSDMVNSTTRKIWPGDYKIDGALCGKVFNKLEPLPFDKMTVGGLLGDPDQNFRGEIGEIIIYNIPLQSSQLCEKRKELANKWGITLDEWGIPDGLPVLKEVAVGPPQKNSAFGYFGESPESPDGKRIAYIVYHESESGMKRIPVDLWICDRDLANRRLVAENITTTNFHNGAMAHWIDNYRMVIGGDGYREVKIVNVETGEIEGGSYYNCWPGGIGHNGQVLLHTINENNLGSVGIYQLDTRNNSVTERVRADQLLSFYEDGKWSGRSQTDTWRFVHGKISEKDTYIGYAAVPKGGKQHLFTSRLDGSDLRIFGKYYPERGSDKPLHWHWYDDELLYGVDQETKDGTPDNLYVKLWDRNGKYIRTLAGPANHTAMSYDRKWFAGDSFYFDDPVWLCIYRSGETVPAAVIFKHSGIKITWLQEGHSNPAFSRDSRRLYYKRPINDTYIQTYYVDLTPLLEK